MDNRTAITDEMRTKIVEAVTKQKLTHRDVRQRWGVSLGAISKIMNQHYKTCQR
jgi:Trp operon repressor